MRPDPTTVIALLGDARVAPRDVSMHRENPIEDILMGYGNPLFDGDEPLPSPRPRIVSVRLWLGALLAGTLGEGTGLPDRHDDQDCGGRGTESEWRQGDGERSQRG